MSSSNGWADRYAEHSAKWVQDSAAAKAIPFTAGQEATFCISSLHDRYPLRPEVAVIGGSLIVQPGILLKRRPSLAPPQTLFRRFDQSRIDTSGPHGRILARAEIRIVQYSF